MRFKLGLLGIVLIAAGLGIPYYLDSQIPRATATVQVHPTLIPSTPPSFSRGSPHHLFEMIVAPETLRLALKQLHAGTGKKKALTDPVINDLRDQISVTPKKGTDLIQITVKDDSKDHAINIANAVAQALVSRQKKIESDRAKRALQALDDEIKAQEEQVAQHRKELTSLIGSYGIPYFDDETPRPLDQSKEEIIENARQKTTEVEANQNESNTNDLSLRHRQYNQVKELYDQARIMLREMIIKQKEDRLLLLTPHSPVTLHQPAQ